MPCAAANRFLSFRLTWRLEFCIFLLTTSTNMRLFNTKKTVTAFSIDLHCLLRQGEWIPLYFKMLFVWNVGPVFWKGRAGSDTFACSRGGAALGVQGLLRSRLGI